MKAHLAWIATLVLGVAVEAAMWAPLSLDQLLDQSDLIVVGPLTSTQPQPNSPHDLATLRVESVLQSKGVRVAYGQVTLVVPSRRGLVASDTIFRTVGDRGVWFLRRDPASKDEAFLADHPHRLKPDTELETVRAAIKARAR